MPLDDQEQVAANFHMNYVLTLCTKWTGLLRSQGVTETGVKVENDREQGTIIVFSFRCQCRHQHLFEVRRLYAEIFTQSYDELLLDLFREIIPLMQAAHNTK